VGAGFRIVFFDSSPDPVNDPYELIGVLQMASHSGVEPGEAIAQFDRE
jgi:hypothetical protein